MILVLTSDRRKGVRGLGVKSIIANSLGIVTFQVHGFSGILCIQAWSFNTYQWVAKFCCVFYRHGQL